MTTTSSPRRFLDTPLGDFLYKLYKSVYPSAFWLRFYIARRLPNSAVPSSHMVTRAKFRGQTIALEHRRSSDSDAEAILQCFGDAQYNMPGGVHGEWQDRLYGEILAAGRTPLIVDCGANIGASVAWFAIRYPRAHIVAIEPAPSNCELLRRNTSQLNIDIRQAGISGEDGRAFLVNEMGHDMTFQVSTDPAGAGIDLISIKTLLDEKSDYIPFLLKVDIEGSERELFRGNWEELNRFPLIIMEPHDWMQPGENISRDFFRFHVENERDLNMKHENIASIALHRSYKQEHPSASAEIPEKVTST